MAEASKATNAHDHDELAERFFSQPPQAWQVTLDDWLPTPPSSAEHRAMTVTFALLAVCAVAAIGIVLFPDSFMVSPVTLGAASGRPVAALAQP